MPVTAIGHMLGSPLSSASSLTAVQRCLSDRDVEKQHDGRLAAVADAHQKGEPPRDDEHDAKPPPSDEFEVGWESDVDRQDPKNWSRSYRWLMSAFTSLLVINATLASSLPSGQSMQIDSELSMSEELGTLVMSLFVLGYSVGPLLWGPLSEQNGRRPVFLFTFLCHSGFSTGCALSRNAASLLVFRFLAGTFASAPLTLAGATLGDIWDPVTRGVAMSFITVAPFSGPVLGPVVSGYMAVAGINWRWVFWILTIFSSLTLIGALLILPETFTPILLSHKARAKRLQTGDSRWYAPLEREDGTLRARLEMTLARPFKLLFSELMLFAITIYMSFVYGCIYLFFEAYPIVFHQTHNLNLGATGLCFLPILVGCSCSVVLHVFIFNERYKRRVRQYDPQPAPPECRLEMAYLGGLLFAIGFFWFGWTSFESVTFWSPALAGGFLGAGIVMIYLPLFNYILDAYLVVSASALASNTVCRSLFGTAFPLFSTQMFEELGTPWASTLLGCIALLMVPIPVLLAKFGARLRMKSKYAPTQDED